jgi:hypothetical protein
MEGHKERDEAQRSRSKTLRTLWHLMFLVASMFTQYKALQKIKPSASVFKEGLIV